MSTPTDEQIVAMISGAAEAPGIMEVVDHFCRQPAEAAASTPTPLSVCLRLRALAEAGALQIKRGRYHATGKPGPAAEQPEPPEAGGIFGGIKL